MFWGDAGVKAGMRVAPEDESRDLGHQLIYASHENDLLTVPT